MTNSTRIMGDNPREPLQCRGCGKDHFVRNFSYWNGISIHVHNIQEDKNPGDVERTVPRIYDALEDH